MAEIQITVVDTPDGSTEIYSRYTDPADEANWPPTPAQAVASYMLDCVGSSESTPNSGFVVNMARFIKSFVRQRNWRTKLIFWLMDKPTTEAFETLGMDTRREVRVES